MASGLCWVPGRPLVDPVSWASLGLSLIFYDGCVGGGLGACCVASSDGPPGLSGRPVWLSAPPFLRWVGWDVRFPLPELGCSGFAWEAVGLRFFMGVSPSLL